MKPDDLAPAPGMAETERKEPIHVVSLEALVRMKFTSFRLKDQVHLQDMIGVGLIDATWLPRFPAELATRLQQLLDNPTVDDPLASFDKKKDPDKK